ncbi:MAG: hypothetical protein FWF31_02305 [Desulfobulbus sp.]|nr:hypothetical protein [Desulfobulbus sp.]
MFFLGVAFGSGTGRFSVPFLIATILYALLGLDGRRDRLHLGLRHVFPGYELSAPLCPVRSHVDRPGGVSGQHVLRRKGGTTLINRLFTMSPQTKVIGLLYLFVALWFMSIFGNYGDPDLWYRARQYQLLHWSLLPGAVAVAAIWYGLRHDDGVMRGFGLTFLFINLYTRFFE